MPDRIIRDELLTSERYWSVGIDAQRLFVHLLLSADALGRFSGKNYTVRAACYPGHPVDAKLIEKLLCDLNDADLIRLYEVGGERYLFIPRYRQRLRAKDSYLPAPPKGINDITDEKSDSSPTPVRLKSDLSPPKEVKGSEVLPSRVLPNPLNAATWDAYSSAYAFRYGADPVRNASTNACIANVVKHLGTDSPHVASFYLTHNDQWYIKKRHPVKALLADAEGLRTQWKTGRKSTSLEARSAEQKDAVVEQIKRVSANIERKENAKNRIT